MRIGSPDASRSALDNDESGGDTNSYSQFPVTSAPGVTNGSRADNAPAIVPFNPQVWGLLPQAQNPSLAEPQRLAPGSVTKNDVSAWCKAFNTASGVAASISKVKDITDMLGVNSGEAETIVNDARAAASNKTLFFLIVAGGAAVYVATNNVNQTRNDLLNLPNLKRYPEGSRSARRSRYKHQAFKSVPNYTSRLLRF